MNDYPATTPDGDRFASGTDISKKIDLNVLYPGPVGALVGKIGLNGNYFFIGSGGQLSTVPRTENLFLCFNDVTGSFGDNFGSYTVTVQVQ